MIRIVMMLWPALVPMLVYVVWCVVRYRSKQAGHEVPPLKGPLFAAVVASIALAVLSFVVLGLGQEANDGKQYHPARYENGVLVPGGFER